MGGMTFFFVDNVSGCVDRSTRWISLSLRRLQSRPAGSPVPGGNEEKGRSENNRDNLAAVALRAIALLWLSQC